MWLTFVLTHFRLHNQSLISCCLFECILCVFCCFHFTIVLTIDALIWCNIAILCLLKWSIVNSLYVYILNSFCFVYPGWLCACVFFFAFFCIPCCLLQFDFYNLVSLDFMILPIPQDCLWQRKFVMQVYLL